MKGVQRRVKWWLWAIEVCTTNLLPVSFSFACHHLNRRKLTEICCNILEYQILSTNISYLYTIGKLESNALFCMNLHTQVIWTMIFINIIWVDHILGQLLEISRNLRVIFYKQNFATNDSKILVNYRGFAWNRTHVHCIQILMLSHEIVLFCGSKYRHFRP